MPGVFGGATITDSAQIGTGTVNSGDILNDTIVNADINTAAAIAYSKLNLTGTIVNADISGSAAIVDSKLAAISTAGKVSGAALTSLTTIPSGAGIIPAANLPAANKIMLATQFETLARFTEVLVGAGTTTFNTSGLSVNGSGGTAAAATIRWALNSGSNFNSAGGSPVFGCSVTTPLGLAGGSLGSCYMGIGSPTVAGTGHTFIVRHIGFKIIVVDTTASLYATQADGTTETASAALTTLAVSDVLDLICVVNGTSSVDYYWRKNGGSLSAATNLTANIPDSTIASSMQFSVANDNTAFNQVLRFGGAFYQR